MADDLFPVFAGVGVGLVFLVLICTGIYFIEKPACYSKYADFQPEYHGLITGCLVKYNGKTVPVESLRIME